MKEIALEVLLGDEIHVAGHAINPALLSVKNLSMGLSTTDVVSVIPTPAHAGGQEAMFIPPLPEHRKP